jgi:hypothetical protein
VEASGLAAQERHLHGQRAVWEQAAAEQGDLLAFLDDLIGV